MDIPLLPLIVRWLHIVSACLALGTPLFIRFFLTPAAERALDIDTHKHLRTIINETWQVMVFLLIAFFLVTGFYTYMVVIMPLDLGSATHLYRALFGLKLLLALVVFFLASALAGKSKALAVIRKKNKLFQTILVLLLLVIIMLAGALRAIHDQALSHHPSALVPTSLPAAATH